MEYKVNELSKLTGVSPRTLRYYEEINLLKSKRMSSNNYRVYGEKEVKLLQQILFYRELRFSLKDIKDIVTSENFDIQGALDTHLSSLLKKREQMDILIDNLRKTILAEKGKITIMDNERFEGLKKNLLEENEKRYGDEIRTKYGDDIIEKSNKKFQNMSEESYQKAQYLDDEIIRLLANEVKIGNPNSENAQKICDLHKKWLSLYWQEGAYSKKAHLGLGQMYVLDERFREHYEKAGAKSAEFFLEALKIYCS